MTRSETAKQYFSQSFNCCQSVIATFGPDFGLNKDLCLKIGAGFGAGMGYKGKTCGAVTGAYITLGLLAGTFTEDQHSYKTTAYEMIDEFLEEFEKRNGSTICNELLGARIDTEEGLEYIREHDLFHTQCPKYVGDAAEILSEIISKKTDKT